MALTLLLPWFPIVLAVGIGGRILGRTRGLGLGILCALFWIVLVQAALGVEIWMDPWNVATLAAGALAITAMGRWSGEMPIDESPSSHAGQNGARPVAHAQKTHIEHLTTAMDQFEDWLEHHGDEANPWPKFDEFLRSLLYQSGQATHVRPYRLHGTGEELHPLAESDPLLDEEPISARRGIIGHVVTTGRSFIAGDDTQGELVNKLAKESRDSIAWSFAIRRGATRLGVVTVGQVGLDPDRHKYHLRALERLVTRFWCSVAETQLNRSATRVDPVTRFHTRSAFLRSADDSLQSSYRQGEPVAVAIIALEGLRGMSDSGRWEVADAIVHEVSNVLRRKVRLDDHLGRFDESRLALLLRRVDSELASLIVAQIMAQVSIVCADEARWGGTLAVRCGVTGSGTDQPTLRALLSEAITQCRRARVENSAVASDLDVEASSEGVSV